MNKITIEKRLHNSAADWIAFLNGDRAMWECGETEMDALGKLVVSHCEEMEIEPMKVKTGVKTGSVVESVKIVRAVCAG